MAENSEWWLGLKGRKEGRIDVKKKMCEGRYRKGRGQCEYACMCGSKAEGCAVEFIFPC